MRDVHFVDIFSLHRYKNYKLLIIKYLYQNIFVTTIVTIRYI